MTFDTTVIPEASRHSFDNLNIVRKVIITHYFEVKKENPRSIYQVIPKIAQDLGYSIDKNGSNSYILKVIQEFTQI